MPKAQQPNPLDLATIQKATRELEEAIRSYDCCNKPNIEWWGVLINRFWQIDLALNPEQRAYGDLRRDEHFCGLPIHQSGPLSRIRTVVDKVACTLKLEGVIGQKNLKDVLAVAREVAAGANYQAIRVDEGWADMLRSAVADLQPGGKDGERATHSLDFR